jgi:hypothetical protein
MHLISSCLCNSLHLLESKSECSHCCYGVYKAFVQDPPDDPVVTICAHVFCHLCVLEYLKGDHNTCLSPECKEQLGSKVTFSKAC